MSSIISISRNEQNKTSSRPAQVAVKPGERRGMRSPRGFVAALVLIASLPLAILYQAIFGAGIETVIHFLFATGFILLSLAIFDFGTGRWMTRLGCASMGALTAIYVIQGVSEALPAAESLHRFAFDLLGQSIEAVLHSLFFVWCIAMLIGDTQGKTRRFGFVIMTAIVGLEVYSYVMDALGESPAEVLKLLYILPVVWLLMESRKPSRRDNDVVATA